MKLTKIKIFKYIAALLTSFILIILLSTGLFIYFFPKEKIKEIAVEQARKTINRELSVGSISYSLKGVVLENITIHDPALEGNDKKPVFAKADKIYLRFSIIDLINKKLKFSYIYLENFKFIITFDDSGNSNIQQLIHDLTSRSSDSAVSTSITNILLHNATLELKNAPEILAPLEGLYNFNGRLHFDRSGNIQIADSKLILPGDRGAMYPELLVHTDTEKLLITGNVELEKTSLLWVYAWGTPKPFYRITGDITDLKITADAVEGMVKASSTLTNSNKILYADGFCRVNIKDWFLLIANADAKIGNSTVWFNYLQFTLKGTDPKFDAKKINAHVTDVMPLIDFIVPKKLFGKVDGEIAYNKGVFNVNAKITNGGYDYKSKLVSDINTDLIIVNNIFKKTDLPVKIYEHPAIASIACTDNGLERIFLNVNMNSFVFAPGKDENPYAELDLSFPTLVTGNVIIKKLVYNEYTFTNLQVNYNLLNAVLTFNNFTTELMEGSAKGNAVVDTSVKPVTVQSKISFNDVKVHNIFSKTRFEKRLYGMASGFANIDFLLSDNIVDSIYGKVEFNIDKGKVSDTGIQNGLGVWLAELKYKLTDLEFNKIYGNIDIKGTRYLVNSFIFNSQNIRFNIKGSFTKELIATPLDINMEFSKYFIQDIARPLVAASGYNKYLKGNWYYIPFIVKGNFTDSKNIKKVE